MGAWPHRQASSPSKFILSCTFTSNHRFYNGRENQGTVGTRVSELSRWQSACGHPCPGQSPKPLSGVRDPARAAQ